MGVIHGDGEGLVGCGMRVYCTRDLDRRFITQEDRKCHASIANFKDLGFENMGEMISITNADRGVAGDLSSRRIRYNHRVSSVEIWAQVEWWKKGSKKPWLSDEMMRLSKTLWVSCPTFSHGR